MRRNVVLLAVCQAVMLTANSLNIVASALVGNALAANKALATLPLALQFAAMMCATIPASMLMERIGRRQGFLAGALAGICGGALAAFAIYRHDFALFCVAAPLFGVFNAFGIYYRFAVVDTAGEAYRARAISYVMAGGVLAAFAGPNLANWSEDWIASAQFAGSYVSMVAVYLIAFVALFFIDIPRPRVEAHAAQGRPLPVIMRHPAFIVATLGTMLGYAAMSLIMTATPLTMHRHAYPFGDTAFVIQWHVFGMFAPSFFTGSLIKRFGVLNVMLAGAALILATAFINLSGTTMPQIWSALLLLGVGWNFLFIGGTALLTEAYTPSDKSRIEAMNNFLVFSAVTLAVLSAGWLQHSVGWEAINTGAIPFMLIVATAVIWLKKRAGTR